MDVAHTGANSLYIEGIRQTDRLCTEIWQMIESNPEYKARTTMLILPDFRSRLRLQPSGNGFRHHRIGEPLSRTTWVMQWDRTFDRTEQWAGLSILLIWFPLWAQ